MSLANISLCGSLCLGYCYVKFNGSDKTVEGPGDKINLGDKVMVGTMNANRENFECGGQDLSAAVLEYGDWLNQLLTRGGAIF